MDALEALTGDHNRVRGLFKRFQDAHESGKDAQLPELGARIVEELEVHTTIEEEVFYPAVRDLSDDVRELVTEGVEEHHVVKNLIEEVGQTPTGSDQWIAKMTVIIENVEHHAEEEESDMFPAIRSGMSAEERETLGEQLSAKKRDLGAPTPEDVVDLSKEQLLEKAREQEIPGRSSMSREALAATVDPR